MSTKSLINERRNQSVYKSNWSLGKAACYPAHFFVTLKIILRMNVFCKDMSTLIWRLDLSPVSYFNLHRSQIFFTNDHDGLGFNHFNSLNISFGQFYLSLQLSGHNQLNQRSIARLILFM